MKQVLFIDTVHPLVKTSLEKEGYHCDWLPGRDYSFYESVIAGYHGIVIRSGITLDKNLLLKAVNLRFIARLGSGLDNIDTQYAASRGIACLNSPEGNRDAVGEHTLGMLLALMNRLLIADHEVRQGIWHREENRGTELKSKCVGIIGFGNMGSAFARRLQGFECRIIAYDKYKSGYAPPYVEEVNMEELFVSADIVSLHVPLTEETRYLACEEWFSRFSKPVVLINTARGPVVNTADLVNALKNGRVTSAALDVIEYEEASFELINTEPLPEPFSYLVNSDRVILSPHIAGWTHESKEKLATVLVEKILKADL